jgi:hypothetical protein
VTVVGRRANAARGNFPSEVVTCRFDDGRELEVFCKYETDLAPGAPTDRPGIAHEAAVYEHVLRPAGLPPRFCGAYRDAATGRTWLFLEYLGGSVHADKAPCTDEAMGLAARWIGGFHAAQEVGPAEAAPPPLRRYDADYYLGWPRRAALLAGDLHRRHPWLAAACRRFEGLVPHLLARPRTVVHGDYYPDNILFRAGAVHAIDWEWAALGAGEIDLASLTDRWPAETVRRCEEEYWRARWPGGAPADFAHAVDVARLYLCFRYMGVSREWLLDEKRQWRVEAARALAERLGLI